MTRLLATPGARGQAEGFRDGGFGVIEPIHAHIEPPEIGMGLLQIGIEGDGPPIGGLRLLVAAQLIERETDVRMGERVIGIERQGLGELIGGRFMTVGLEEYCAEQMQRVRQLRHHLDDPAIGRLRRGEIPIPVAGEALAQDRLNGRWIGESQAGHGSRWAASDIRAIH